MADSKYAKITVPGADPAGSDLSEAVMPVNPDTTAGDLLDSLGLNENYEVSTLSGTPFSKRDLLYPQIADGQTLGVVPHAAAG